MSRLLKAAPLQEAIHASLAEAVHHWRKVGVQPRLDLILCEERGSCSIYADGLERNASRNGITVVRHSLSNTTSESEYRECLVHIGADPEVHAILPLVPLPPQIRREAVTSAIPTEKDVDAVSPQTLGLFFTGHPTFIPSTARAVDRLLDFYRIPIAGKRVVVLGRSPSAGRAIAWQCICRDATVTVCHSKTNDLPNIAHTAEILISAMGKSEMVDEHYVQSGAVVIDVGLNLVGEKITGDVCFDRVEPLTEAITPVPGGVGPITTAVLLEATLEATSRAQAGRPGSEE